MAQQAPLPAVQPSVSQRLMQLSSGYMASAALYAVAKLNIADRLASGSRAIAELAREAAVNEDALYRVMRLLASFGIFKEVGLRYFSLTPEAEPLRSDAPDSVRDLLIWISNPFHLRVYADAMHSVKTGNPAVEKTTGLPCFDYFAGDREVSAEFNAGMTSISRTTVPAVLEAYDFSAIETLVDVAGGHGFVLSSILKKYPRMRGVLFDVAQVVAGARPGLEELGLADRCAIEHGDFFEEVPAGGDTYLMQHILHDWDDERAVTILHNVRHALEDKPEGRLLVLEDVIVPGNDPAFVKALDIEMLLMPGGRERTADEFRDLFIAGGFSLERIVPTRAPIKIIEGIAV